MDDKFTCDLFCDKTCAQCTNMQANSCTECYHGMTLYNGYCNIKAVESINEPLTITIAVLSTVFLFYWVPWAY